MSNSEQWEKYAVSAGLISGDLTFPIVYCPELHFSEFASALADMKNSVAVRLTITFCVILNIKKKIYIIIFLGSI